MTVNTAHNTIVETKTYFTIYLKSTGEYDYFTLDYSKNETHEHFAEQLKLFERYKKAKVKFITYNKARECIEVDAEF